MEVIEERGSLASFVWDYEVIDSDPLRATSAESVALARELKGRGFAFVGPTTAYAFMQSMGLVNDHVAGCYVREKVVAARAAFVHPDGG